MRRFLIPALAVGALLGLPMLILQRWAAETRFAAIVLVITWMALAGILIAVYVRRRPELRLPALGTWAVIVLATVAVGYLTGFRDVRVDEDVAMADARAGGGARERGLAGTGRDARSGRPLELASGRFAGADGHAGMGDATVVEQPGGARVLTFTEFDVDPGIDVDVYLTMSPDSIDDRVELGSLKGNVGDQQYEIPVDADLRAHPNVILWCKPFTVRIAVAELNV